MRGGFAAAAAIAVALLLVQNSAQAVLLTFDDLPGDGSAVPIGYGGVDWSNFNNFDGVNYANNPSGYENGVKSPNNVIFNNFGNPASILESATPFALNSFYITAAWNDGLNVRIDGSGGQTRLIVIDTSGPTLVTLDWANLASVTFTSGGGTSHDFPSGFNSEQFAIDNITINGATPIPAALPLFASGLAGFGWLARLRLRRRP